MKFFNVIWLVIFLSSCGSVMKTEEELINLGGKSPKYCTQLSPVELRKSLEEYYSRCLLNQQQISLNGVNISTEFEVYKQKTDNATKYTVKTGKYYVFSAFAYDEPSSSCKSEMLVISNLKNASADSAGFSPYKDIAAGLKPSCW